LKRGGGKERRRRGVLLNSRLGRGENLPEARKQLKQRGRKVVAGTRGVVRAVRNYLRGFGGKPVGGGGRGDVPTRKAYKGGRRRNYTEDG